MNSLIAMHPNVASINAELTLFSRYIAPVIARYDNEQRMMDQKDWEQGLPLVLSKEQLNAWLSDVLVSSYSAVQKTKPGAKVILDKHPNYSQYLDTIVEFLPRAKVIHIIRDGRDVAVSMMSARKRVGHSPGEINRAAEIWKKFITGCRESKCAQSDSYKEVLYHELLNDTQGLVCELLEFLNLDSEKEVVDLLTREDLVKKEVSSPNPNLKGQRNQFGGAWSKNLTLWQRYRFDRIAGDLLVSLGYASPGWWAMGAFDKLQVKFISLAKRIKTALRNAWQALSTEPK